MILATTDSYILDLHDEQSMYVHATFLIRCSQQYDKTFVYASCMKQNNGFIEYTE